MPSSSSRLSWLIAVASQRQRQQQCRQLTGVGGCVVFAGNFGNGAVVEGVLALT